MRNGAHRGAYQYIRDNLRSELAAFLIVWPVGHPRIDQNGLRAQEAEQQPGV